MSTDNPNDLSPAHDDVDDDLDIGYECADPALLAQLWNEPIVAEPRA
jgi:hypothetical protein